MAQITIPTVINAWEVEEAVIATLVPRLAAYMTQLGYPAPRSYTRATSFDKFPEDQLPCIIVSCPGLNDQPRRAGDRTYQADWFVGVGAMVEARTEDETRKAARVIGSLIRATILQQPSLGGFANGVTWLNETYDQLELPKRRSLASAELEFAIRVEGVVDANELPYIEGMEGLPTPSDIDSTSYVVDVTKRGEA